MLVYTLAQIRNGTGFNEDVQFIEVNNELQNVLGHARAVIAEGIHEDRHFRQESLESLDRLIADLGAGDGGRNHTISAHRVKQRALLQPSTLARPTLPAIPAAPTGLPTRTSRDRGLHSLGRLSGLRHTRATYGASARAVRCLRERINVRSHRRSDRQSVSGRTCRAATRSLSKQNTRIRRSIAMSDKPWFVEGLRRYRAGEKLNFSTSISENDVTWGYGELDDYGFWEFPVPYDQLSEYDKTTIREAIKP